MLEAAAYGLPVVGTDLLAEQLGWESGRELLTAPPGDATAFADACVTAYRDGVRIGVGRGRPRWSGWKQSAPCRCSLLGLT